MKPTIVTDLWHEMQKELDKITPERCDELLKSCGWSYAEVINTVASGLLIDSLYQY